MKYVFVAVVSGMLSSFLIMIYWLGLHFLEQNPFAQYKYLYFPIYGLCFIATFYYVRYYLHQNHLRAQQAILVGFLLNGITCLCLFVALKMLFSTSSGQTIKQQHIQQSLQLLESTKVYLEEHKETLFEFRPENLEQSKRQIQQLSDNDLAFDQAFGVGIAGVVFTFLFALFFKKTS
ncbi:MAG: DUF4199 family protein [Cytophagales bacterium]|nr:DUF4199 family protein [Cytophagales bacterium]MDW8385228.1 DUF4199 family protein [Flammeovirgaceae bacterium]